MAGQEKDWEAFALPSGETKGRRIALRSLVSLEQPKARRGRRPLRGIVGLTGPNPEERTTWVHVAPHGEWQGHVEGPFSLGETDFESIVSHDAERPSPISWDYEHASLVADGEPKPAAGYVVSVEHREDGLWAQTEFTERAADLIRKGEYRFCSGVFDFDATDPQSGRELPCVMDSIALTNRPFIAGMEPIALTRSSSRRRAASTGETQMPMDPPRSATPVPSAVSFSRKALDKALDELESDSLNEASLQLVMNGLMAQARAKAALTATAAAEPAAAEPDGDEPTAASRGARAASVPQGHGAPQDAEMDGGTDIAPPSEPTSPPPGQGAPDAVATAVAPPEEPVLETPGVDDAETDVAMMEIAKATGLDDAGMAAALRANMDAIVALLTGVSAPTALTKDANDLVVAELTRSLVEARRQINEGKRSLSLLQKRSTDADADSQVDALVKSGRIHPSKETRAAWVALARSQPKQFAAAAATLQPVYPVERGPAAPPPAVGSGSENIVAPAAPAETPLDEKDPLVVECSRALDEADKALVRIGQKPMSKERRDQMIRLTLSRAQASRSSTAS